ncbi:MAG TPA: glycosyltransferase family 2 protein [Solirubrobacteraceae bacterium]|nr:glycosyltransferase family 2 protein [Solirubrobacteraceae bacterium]
MSAASVRLTVVVLNYDGRALLQAMLASLESQVCEPFRTLVVDNGSSDDSREFLAAAHPEVEVLALERNIGVTAALNRGLRRAGTEYVALFNNDVELEPDCLAELLAGLEAHPQAGSVAPKMRDYRDRGLLDGAGDLLSWRGGGRRRGHGQPDDGRYDDAEEVFGPCGGAAVLRRTALERVGGFEESYFAYYEDIDWAFRAQLAGFHCRYVPSAVVYHHGSATLGRGFNDFNGYHLWRNPVWLVCRCYPAATLVRHLPEVLLGQLGNLYRAGRERRLRVWARAMRDALRGMPAALRGRREVQRRRTIGARELERRARLGT